ncbi:MAG: DUF169 domain-containing protein [Chloroflexi bacterium]|jgi:uncharacterized protein (DUF169 family)|nr:DUF169 domain-containing protein [Chloroflexota bacterium]
MRPLQTDLSIYSKFNFERPPLGIKFLFHKPEGIEQLDKSLALCEMIREAHQRGTPFYMSKDNENCFGLIPLGMKFPIESVMTYAEAGEVGPKFEIYQEPRANRRIYDRIPRLAEGSVNYVAFSPLDKLTFDPDLLILTTTISQAEIVLRAMSHSTGEIWAPKTTPVLACAWLFVYPYKSGKVNYMVTGLGYGMKNRKVLPEGLMLISIPWDWIPTITQNLQEMDWVPGPFKDTYEEFLARAERIGGEVVKESQNF